MSNEYYDDWKHVGWLSRFCLAIIVFKGIRKLTIILLSLESSNLYSHHWMVLFNMILKLIWRYFAVFKQQKIMFCSAAAGCFNKLCFAVRSEVVKTISNRYNVMKMKCFHGD